MDPASNPPDAASIMLIPDDAYKAQRPKTKAHHMTLAYFGKASDLTPVGVTRLRSTVDMLARFAGGPIMVHANGIGLFGAGRAGVAVVDLVDGIGTFDLRAQVENLYGKRYGYTLDEVRIDYTHGFTPHITREYLDAEDADFYAQLGPEDIPDLKFEIVAIGLWHGQQKYEVSL